MIYTFGRIIGFAMQTIGALMVVNDHPNPLEYEPFLGSFAAEKFGGLLIILVGVVVYRFFGGRYSLITDGLPK